MEEYLVRNVPEWRDEQRISALFSVFKPREQNPEAYDFKVDFWKKAILNAANQKFLSSKDNFVGDNGFIINISKIKRCFTRNGLQPLGLETVFVRILIHRDVTLH